MSQRQIVALRHENAGNNNHVMVVAQTIGQWIGAEVTVLDVRLRSRLLGPAAMVAARFGLLKMVWSVFFEGEIPGGLRSVMICSTLGRGEVPSAVLSQYWGCENVHIGRPSRISRRYFTAMIAPQGRTAHPDDIVLPIAPTAVTVEAARAAAEQFIAEHQLSGRRLWTMLIGGDGGGYVYTDADWKAMIDGLHALAERHEIRWLLTTSPRTGVDVERRLRDAVNPQHVAYAVWFAQKPQRVVNAYLGAAERIFVAEESISMLSDAMVVGKPVYAMRPAGEPSDLKAREFLSPQFEAGRLMPLTLIEMKNLRVDAAHDAWFKPLTRSWQEALREQLAARSELIRNA